MPKPRTNHEMVLQKPRLLDLSSSGRSSTTQIHGQNKFVEVVMKNKEGPGEVIYRMPKMVAFSSPDYGTHMAIGSSGHVQAIPTQKGLATAANVHLEKILGVIGARMKMGVAHEQLPTNAAAVKMALKQDFEPKKPLMGGKPPNWEKPEDLIDKRMIKLIAPTENRLLSKHEEHFIRLHLGDEIYEKTKPQI